MNEPVLHPEGKPEVVMLVEGERPLAVIVRVRQTSVAAPSQWDAWTDDGRYLYLRYRHGRGSVEHHLHADSDTWNYTREGPREENLLVRWDDQTGGGFISLEDFCGVAGLVLAPDVDRKDCEW